MSDSRLRERERRAEGDPLVRARLERAKARVSARDPRKDPRARDVLRVGRLSVRVKVVTDVDYVYQATPMAAIVYYATTPGGGGYCSIAAWHSWVRNGEVLRRGL